MDVTASSAYCHIFPGIIISFPCMRNSLLFSQMFLSVDGTPQVNRNILLTGLFMAARILTDGVSKA